MPYINAPYRNIGKGSVFEWVRSKLVQAPIPDTHGRVIDLAPWPTHIDKDGRIHFSDSGRKEYYRMKDEVVQPDVLIFATGYQQEFPFFKDQNEAAAKSNKSPQQLLPHEKPYPTPDQANIRKIWKQNDLT